MRRRKQKSYYKKVETPKFDLNWESRLSELKLFKSRFGHCNVPQYWPENKSLGGWVIRQRAYRDRLSPEQFKKLEKIGFIWDLPDYWWQEKYQELVRFREEFGHCNVSKGMEACLPLADWCVKQRQDYKNRRKRLTKEKIQLLEKIGFDWGTVIRVSWEFRYRQLLEFHKEHGHCNVPRNWGQNPPLANWVAIQRRDRDKLTDRLKALLDAIGFKWQVKKRKNK